MKPKHIYRLNQLKTKTQKLSLRLTTLSSIFSNILQWRGLTDQRFNENLGKIEDEMLDIENELKEMRLQVISLEVDYYITDRKKGF